MKSKSKINNGRSRKGVNRYVDEEFAKLLDEIKQTRVLIKKDDINTISADWRLTLAITRHPKIILIKEDIINADLK